MENVTQSENMNASDICEDSLVSFETKILNKIYSLPNSFKIEN